MTVNAIDGKLFSVLSKIDGVTLSTLSKVLGQTKAASGPLPTDLTNLELWLPVSAISQSDNTVIATWNDQSGNARNATGSNVAGDRPKYRTAGGPTSGAHVELCPDLAHSPRYFTLPNFLTGFTSAEATIILQLLTDPAVTSGANGGPPFGNWGSATTGGVYNFSDGKIYDEFGTNTRKTTNDPTTNLTTWHVFNVRSASANYTWSINGATTGNDFFNTGTNTVGWGTAPLIGFDVNDNRSIFGNLVDVILYSRILNQATERGPVVYTYLNNTYGFSLPTS